jgi:hypothetical protein
MTINLTLDLNDCNIISSYKILENSGRARERPVIVAGGGEQYWNQAPRIRGELVSGQ